MAVSPLPRCFRLLERLCLLTYTCSFSVPYYHAKGQTDGTGLRQCLALVEDNADLVRRSFSHQGTRQLHQTFLYWSSSMPHRCWGKSLELLKSRKQIIHRRINRLVGKAFSIYISSLQARTRTQCKQVRHPKTTQVASKRFIKDEGPWGPWTQQRTTSHPFEVVARCQGCRVARQKCSRKKGKSRSRSTQVRASFCSSLQEK